MVSLLTVACHSVYAVADRITDLSTAVVRGEGLTLQWTAPTSTAAIVRYDIRFSTVPITTLNWNKATSLAAQDEWLFNDVAYRAAIAVGKTNVTDILPAPGSTLESRSTFAWNSVQGATQYGIELGRTLGGSQLGTWSTGTDTAISIPVPLDGSIIYLRIWYFVSGVWGSNDFQYVAGTTVGVPSTIVNVSPEPNTTIGSPQKFSWNPVSNATEYWVDLGFGITPASEIYSQSTKTMTAVVINNIPQQGQLLSLTIYWKIGRTWAWKTFTYTALDQGEPVFDEVVSISPLSGETILSPAAFAWNPVLGAQEYWVDLGSTLGRSDLFSASTGIDTTVFVRNIPQDGRNLFLRVWYKFASTLTGVVGSIEQMVISGLGFNTQYYFAVRTLDASGQWSLISNVLSVKTKPETVTVALAWDPNVDQVTGYKLYRGLSPGNYSEVRDVGNLTTTSWSGLQYGTTYYFVVTAYNDAALESVPSNEVSYTP